jgi:hypothetical protein
MLKLRPLAFAERNIGYRYFIIGRCVEYKINPDILNTLFINFYAANQIQIINHQHELIGHGPITQCWVRTVNIRSPTSEVANID